MLSVIYKLASAAIANRIKPLLNDLISHNQNGFVPGRYIGESTRLIIDIMHLAENNKIPGLLMLIDFEKAYDSISWKFIYKVLPYMGFTDPFIAWIKLFNTDIQTTIMQSGIMSEFIKIGRGCRQGDPISWYLFIMAAEVLNILITYNDKVTGITVNGFEFKLSQFADDTTLILDGSCQSIESALNILEIFGTYSAVKLVEPLPLFSDFTILSWSFICCCTLNRHLLKLAVWLHITDASLADLSHRRKVSCEILREAGGVEDSPVYFALQP